MLSRTDPSDSAACCIVCDAAAMIEVTEYPAFRRVTSDFRPWSAGGRLAVCQCCGTTQKPITEAWRTDCRSIYADYVAYRQGAEQSVFLDGKPIARSRSHVFLHWIMDAIGDRATGRALDF